jgi:Ca2+-transporting ATPase
MIFLALTCLQLGVAVGLRPVQLTRQNPMLPAAVAGSFLLAVAGVYLPVLQDLLGTSALPAADLALAVGAGALGWLATRLTRRRHRGTAPTSGARDVSPAERRDSAGAR